MPSADPTSTRRVGRKSLLAAVQELCELRQVANQRDTVASASGDEGDGGMRFFRRIIDHGVGSSTMHQTLSAAMGSKRTSNR